MEMTNEKAQEILQALWISKYPDYSEEEIREALMKGIGAIKRNKMQPIKDGFPEIDSTLYLVQDSNGNVWSAEYDENQEDPAERFGEWIQMFDPHTLGVIDSEWRAYDDIVAWGEFPELYEGEETSQAKKYKEIGEALSAGIQAGLQQGTQEAAGEKEPETILAQLTEVKARFNLLFGQFFLDLAEHYLEKAEDKAAKLEKLREELKR